MKTQNDYGCGFFFNSAVRGLKTTAKFKVIFFILYVEMYTSIENNIRCQCWELRLFQNNIESRFGTIQILFAKHRYI